MQERSTQTNSTPLWLSVKPLRQMRLLALSFLDIPTLRETKS
jgi:hypothetical protein